MLGSFAWATHRCRCLTAESGGRSQTKPVYRKRRCSRIEPARWRMINRLLFLPAARQCHAVHPEHKINVLSAV